MKLVFVVLLVTIVVVLASHQCGNTQCEENERCMFDSFLKTYECVKCPANGRVGGPTCKCGISEGKRPGHPLTAIECCDNERCIHDIFWKTYYCSPTAELRF